MNPEEVASLGRVVTKLNHNVYQCIGYTKIYGCYGLFCISDLILIFLHQHV